MLPLPSRYVLKYFTRARIWSVVGSAFKNGCDMHGLAEFNAGKHKPAPQIAGTAIAQPMRSPRATHWRWRPAKWSVGMPTPCTSQVLLVSQNGRMNATSASMD